MAFRSSSIIALATAASAAPAVPTGVASGDIIVVFLFIENASPTVTPPTGFTLKYGPDTISSDFFVYTYWKRTTGADTGTYSFTWTGSQPRQAIALAFSGRITSGDPFGPARDIQTAAAGSTTFPSLSCSANANADAVAFYSSFSSGTFTQPTGYTKRSASNEVGSATKDAIAGGTETASGATWSVVDDQLCMLVTLEVAGGGGATDNPQRKRWGGVPGMRSGSYW